jgi:hypothetical protein
MNVQKADEIRVLTVDELDEVTGGSIIGDAITRILSVALAEKGCCYGDDRTVRSSQPR